MTVGSEPLRYWIDMTLECVRRDHTDLPSARLSVGDQRGPFLTARAMGMALAALHDAHAIATARTPLLSTIPVPAGLATADPTMAAAAACHRVLVLRYPKQARMLIPAWARWVELFNISGTGAAEAAGKAFGTAVHAFGSQDSAIARIPFVPSGAPYTHIAPPNEPEQGYAGGSWGTSTPLLATRVPFPPPPGRANATQVNPTAHYQADFAKVATKGIEHRHAGDRSYEEEIVGIYWGYDGPPELGTPPRLYLQVALVVLDAIQAVRPNAMNLAEELALVAGMGIALADAGIDAWHYKYSPEHMMWRPVVGIREAIAGNGVANPTWLPLGRPDTNGVGQALTPNFPAYPSGHATFGAAVFQLLRLFLVEKALARFGPNGRDTVDFDFVSDEYDGRNVDPRTSLPRELLTRHYDSLWEAIVDNSVSRVFLGVHWQFDGITMKTNAEPKGAFGIPTSPADLGEIGGVWLGAQIANQIALRIGVTPATITASRID